MLAQRPRSEVSPPDVAAPDSSAERCRICGNDRGNRRMLLREMMFHSRESFPYFECSACGTIQIEAFPPSMAPYYPADYTSFTSAGGSTPSLLVRTRDALQLRFILRPSFERAGRWYRLLASLELTVPSVEAVGRAHLRRDARVLEVGSGYGRNLRALVSLGFRAPIGIDPYLPERFERSGMSLRQMDVADLDPTDRFDLILLHHSLEHVPEPIGVLAEVRRHLAKNGLAIVAMPIVGAAYRRYGPDWFQLDPPRHLHIFTLKSFDIALARSGLSLVDSYFNSRAVQFRCSEMYRRDLSPVDRTAPYFVETLQRLGTEGALRAEARDLNGKRDGDQAVFYLRDAASQRVGS
jgi:SAM-dependent methyltransferase